MKCYGEICFFALDPAAPKFFGFAEFLAGLALMILAWTIADVRYRFRISAAPIPLQEVTYGVVAAVGLLTLLTDLWRAQAWLVPHLQNSWFTPALWQAVLGLGFFATFLVWAWYAFIRPPVFGERNALRYSRAVASYVLRGISSELAVIADELALSAKQLIQHASDRRALPDTRRKASDIERHAEAVLLTMGDKRFCRAVVESSPRIALEIFREIGRTKKYGVTVQPFGKNLVQAALVYKDSFLYQETSIHDAGLVGLEKPLTQAIFGSHQLVEEVRTLLDSPAGPLDADQWKAYSRMVLVTLRDVVRMPFWHPPSAIYRAMTSLQGMASDLWKLDGAEDFWDTDVMRRFNVQVDFIMDAIGALGQQQVTDGSKGLLERLAAMAFEAIVLASAIRRPRRTCWSIQRMAVWRRFFDVSTEFDSPSGRTIRRMVRKLVYEEIKEMEKYSNFRGAKLLGLCLNVMGFNSAAGSLDRVSRALQKAILAWVRANYAALYERHPALGDACLTEGFSYDKRKRRLVRTRLTDGPGGTASRDYFEIDAQHVVRQKKAGGDLM